MINCGKTYPIHLIAVVLVSWVDFLYVPDKGWLFLYNTPTVSAKFDYYLKQNDMTLAQFANIQLSIKEHLVIGLFASFCFRAAAWSNHCGYRFTGRSLLRSIHRTTSLTSPKTWDELNHCYIFVRSWIGWKRSVEWLDLCTFPDYIKLQRHYFHSDNMLLHGCSIRMWQK